MGSFLDLPLEIREEIYKHLLLYPPPAPGASSPPSITTDPEKPILHPSILAVSKQTHLETLPILYAQNTFRAHSALLHSFPSLEVHGRRRPYPQISESSCPGVRLIRRWYLKARLDCGPFWTAERVAEAFTGADELTVEVSQSMYCGASSEVLCLFEGVRDVKRVRFWGSIIGLQSYVVWLEGAMSSPVGGEIVPLGEDREGRRGG